MSKIKVNEIEKASGSGITVPTGTSFTITDGLAVSSLPTVTVAKGGTNLTSFTAGDLLYATGSTTLAKLPKGTASQTLKMNAGATAPEWATVAAATLDFVKIASGSISSAVSSYSIDGHFSSTYKYYELIFDDVYGSTTGLDLYMRIIEGGSVISGSNYGYSYRYQGVNNSGANNVGDTGGWTSTSANVTNNMSSSISSSAMLHFRIYDPLATDKHKHITFHNLVNYNNNGGLLNQIGGFQYRSANAISGVQIFPQSGTINAGNWTLYGIKP